MNKLIPKSRKALALAGAASAAAIFGLAFLVTTYALPAQKPPPPTPNATQLAQLTQIIEYNKSHDVTPGVPFVGEVNGFTFGGTPVAWDTCNPSDLWSVGAEHSSTLLAPSGLDFQVDYVPAGFQTGVFTPQTSGSSGPVIVIECKPDGPIVSLSQSWVSGSQAFEVHRRPGSPTPGSSDITRDRLQPMQINGRSSIVVGPRFKGEEASIVMRDDHSVWTISSKSLGVDELVKIAQSIKG
ncbi:MAG TPA: hypothetical protein VFY10_05685 [Dehalococcoidia bacterium]|nr:hypothetical protein [Dehalococcoidia bacterium]